MKKSISSKALPSGAINLYNQGYNMHKALNMTLTRSVPKKKVMRKSGRGR